ECCGAGGGGVLRGRGSRVAGHGSRVTGHGSRGAGRGARMATPRVIARRARSARRGNRVVGHRVSGIAIRPRVAKVCLGSGWRNADYADLHADYAEGFLHRIGASARAGIGAAFLWVPHSVALQSPWPPHPARRFSDVPPPHNMGRGTGGEATRLADLLSLHSTRDPHRRSEEHSLNSSHVKISYA